jgi:hypothetical protein
MKIAGVAGAKHPTLKKGDIIELSPERKLEEQAKQEVISRSETGYQYLPTKSVVSGNVQIIKGRQTKKPEPSQYIGTVKVSYRRLRLADDRLFPEQTTLVKLHITDSKDELGLPDFKTKSFSILK